MICALIVFILSGLLMPVTCLCCKLLSSALELSWTQKTSILLNALSPCVAFRYYFGCLNVFAVFVILSFLFGCLLKSYQYLTDLGMC